MFWVVYLLSSEFDEKLDLSLIVTKFVNNQQKVWKFQDLSKILIQPVVHGLPHTKHKHDANG